MMNNAILNDVFLNDLFKQTDREIYARITSLTQKEQAIEYIEGKVSGGSINVDGKSAIRRSCSLTLVAKDININEFYWGIKNKFKLEIGLSNQVEPNYDEIIWFPQGIFLITNFDTNYTTKNCQISIKGKDKMCLLNGEFGGHLPHNTDFGKEKYHDLKTDTVTETDIPIATIVREAIRNFGDELPHNIIINDIEDAGLILLEYRGNTPMYMFRKINSDIFTNVTFNEKQKCYYINESGQLQSTTIGDNDNIIYDNLVDLEGEIEPTKIILSLKNVGQITEEEFYNGSFYTIFKESYIDINGYQYKDLTDKEYISGDNIYKYAYIYDKNENYYQAQDEYYIARFENGSTPGYRLTDLTYAGDLISKAGETVVNVLDKIKKMLGDFEYFYNLDGKFVFQKQKNYNFSNWSSSELDEVIYNDSTLNMEKPIFNLLDNKLITSFKNSPKITDLRNDYSVWGSRKTNSGTERTLHARYAIDNKPIYYKTFKDIKNKYKIYTSKEEIYLKEKQNLLENEEIFLVDWREIIYQMALDYRRHYHEDDFLYYLAQNNINYYPSGVTGYERYYIDLEGFWRTLYNPNPEPKSKNISYLDASKHLSEDTLYISNSYRPLKEEEQDEFVIDIEQLYILDYNAELTSYQNIEGFEDYPIPPDEIPPKTPELIPFLKSEYCCLHYNEDKTKCDDIYFYANSEGKVGDGTDDIKILNSLELNQIYIKERGPFITLEGYENMQEYKFVGKVTEENFNINKKVYWIKNEDEEYILATKWNKNQDYYIVYNTMQEEFKQLDLSELEDININEVENFDIRNYLINEDIIKIYEDNYQWRKENLEGVFMSKYESEATQIIYTEKKIEYVNKIKKQLKIDTLNNFKWIKDDIENQYLYYEYEDNEIEENKISYDRIIRIYSHEFGIEAIKSKYRELRLDIREKYYANNNGKELRSYYYVKGEVDPGDEWPSTDISNNNLFIIKKQNNDSKYQFWVFKYPIGTSINQYPDDYTNYAQKQLENYLNQYGWDKLLIKTNEPLKFSELNQDVQRLYYKETGSMIEYFNLLQYNNFNELKTNKNELINNLPLIKPSSYLEINDFISQVENFCKNYCNGLNNIARKKLEEIYRLNRNNFKTNEEYNETITSMYLEFINYLETLYPKQLKYPAYDISRVQYQIVYYDFNNDSITGNYWTKLITESPEQLEFWFDFINGENSYLSKYSIPAIGPRTKVVNDKDVKAIYYKEVPNTIFITSQEEYKKYSHQTGYNYIQLPKEMESVFVTSSRGKSAQKAVEDLLYKHCYGTETATIQTVPIYHLQPNTCIYIRNNETNIDGDYLISKIIVSLDHKKMMSITASKVMPRII